MNQVEPCLLLPLGTDPERLAGQENREFTVMFPSVPYVGSHVEVVSAHRRVVKVLVRRHDIPVVWYQPSLSE